MTREFEVGLFVGVPNWIPQMKSLPAQESLCPHLGKMLSHRLSAVESAFQPHLTRRAGNNSHKLCGPVVLKLRSRQTELITLRAKPVPGLDASRTKHRQGD